MKQQAGLPVIIGAVVVLLVVVFGLYKVFFSSSDPDPAAAAADHRDMGEFYRKQGRVGSGAAGGTGAPTSPSGTTTTP